MSFFFQKLQFCDPKFHHSSWGPRASRASREEAPEEPEEPVEPVPMDEEQVPRVVDFCWNQPSQSQLPFQDEFFVEQTLASDQPPCWFKQYLGDCTVLKDYNKPWYLSYPYELKGFQRCSHELVDEVNLVTCEELEGT